MRSRLHVRGYSYPRTWVAMTTYMGTSDQNDGYPCPKLWATMPNYVGHGWAQMTKGLGKSGQKHI